VISNFKILIIRTNTPTLRKETEDLPWPQKLQFWFYFALQGTKFHNWTVSVQSNMAESCTTTVKYLYSRVQTHILYQYSITLCFKIYWIPHFSGLCTSQLFGSYSFDSFRTSYI